MLPKPSSAPDPRQVVGLHRPRVGARQEILERGERAAAQDALDRPLGQVADLVQPHEAGLRIPGEAAARRSCARSD